MWNLPLFVITEVILFNKSFYVAFNFIKHEQKDDFQFMLNTLQDNLIEHDLSDSQVIVTDDNQAFQNAFSSVFSIIKNLLCL